MRTLELRCSALPLAFLCPGSVRPEGVLVDEVHEMATLGTAAHAGAVELVRTGRVDRDGTGALAKRYGVDETELRVLLAQAAQLWAEIHDSFPNASTEQELSYEAPDGSFKLTGHADIIASSVDSIHVGDWKFGRLDADHAKQLEGYAALGLLESGAREATAGVLWVRDHEYEHYTMSAADVAGWLDRLRATVVDWDGVYRSGEHCTHCPRNHECPAFNAVIRRDVAAIADLPIEEAAIAALTPSQRVALVVKARAVAQLAERFVSAVKADVIRNGDVVADGKRLTLQRSERRHLVVLNAFPVLQQHLEDEEMAEVIDISISKAEQIVAHKAGKGNGAGAVRQLNQALNDVGAIQTGMVTQLVVRRA